MQFKVREGPWEVISKGEFQGHESELYLNSDDVIFSTVFETEKGKRIGSLLQFFRIFLARGNLEGFVDTLPKQVIALNIHSEQATFKFLILDSGINYSSLKEEEFLKNSDELLKALQQSSKMVSDVAKAYDVELIELKDCSEEEKQAFYSMPLVSLLISPVVEKKPVWAETPSGVGEIILGLTKDGNLVKEPLSLFQRTIISDGAREDRLLVLRVFIESVLLSKTPVIIIDWNGEFTGLSVPTEKSKELKEYKSDLEPAGFPVKEFLLLEELKINMQAVDAEGMCEVLGLGEGKARDAIVELLQKNAENKLIPQIVNAVKRSGGISNLSKFEQNKVLRVLQLFEHRYPGLFNGKNDVDELSKHWAKSLGRASIVSFKGLDEREALLLMNSLFNELTAFYANKKQLNTVIVLPQAEHVFGRDKQNRIVKNMEECLLVFEEHGIGYLMETSNVTDLERIIGENYLSQAQVVKGNDVGIQVKGRKSYRVFVRPPLSKLEAAVSSGRKIEEKEERKRTGLQLLRV